MTTRPRFQKRDDRLLHGSVPATDIRHDYACAPFDRAARAADEQWGVDRLPSLVPPAMAERYGAALAYLNACMAGPDPAATAAAAMNCIRGLTALDAEARRLGHTPAPPDIWPIDIDGQAYAFVREVADIAPACAAMPTHKVFSLRQAVIALDPARFALPTMPPAPPPPQARHNADLDADFIPF